MYIILSERFPQKENDVNIIFFYESFFLHRKKLFTYIQNNETQSLLIDKETVSAAIEDDLDSIDDEMKNFPVACG